MLINPEGATGLRIERDDIVRRLCQIHNPINDERCRLKLLERPNLKNPLLFEIPDVGKRNLIQPAMVLVPM